MKILSLTKLREMAHVRRAENKAPGMLASLKGVKLLLPASKDTLADPAFLAKAAASKTATLYVYEQIGADFWTGGGCTAAAVVEAIAEAKKAGAAALDVRIISEGGDCFEGAGIHEALKRCGMKTTAYNDGLCASAATLVALGCDKFVAAPTSTWMMHRAWTIAGGHEADMRATGELLAKLDTTIASVYAGKSGKTVDECLTLMTEQKGGPDGNWMNAEECKAAGFADEIASAGSDGDAEDDGDGGEVMDAVSRLISQTHQRITNQARIAAALDRAKTTGASPGSSKPGGQPSGAKK